MYSEYSILNTIFRTLPKFGYILYYNICIYRYWIFFLIIYSNAENKVFKKPFGMLYSLYSSIIVQFGYISNESKFGLGITHNILYCNDDIGIGIKIFFLWLRTVL